MTNMQTIGQATPVLLLQTQDTGMPNRAAFGNDKEYTKFLKKLLKEANAKKTDDKKKEDDKKKPRTFTYWEMVSLLMLVSVPMAAIEIIIGYGMFETIKRLALQ